MSHRGLRVAAVLVGLVLVVAACGGSGKSSSTTTTTGSIRVGLVYGAAGRGDQGFNDAAYAGLTKARQQLGVQTQDLEPSKSGDDREALLRTLAGGGYTLIIGVGAEFADPIKKVAADYPNLRFAIVDDDTDQSANITDLVFAEEQGSYLVGAAAALTSKSGRLGFLGGVHSDLIKKYEAGFVAGAQKENPAATVDVKYISEPPDLSGFSDPAKANAIALAQYQGGADVIFHAARASGTGVFSAAAAATPNVWAIGDDADQYKAAAAGGQSKILTSMIKRVDVAVFDAIRDFQTGTLKSGDVRYDLRSDGLAFATSGGFLTSDVIAKLNDLKRQIISGQIVVPTTP
jgi:basic membrane protein A